MKVNEVITEASLWDLTKQASTIAKQAKASKEYRQQVGARQASGMLKPNQSRAQNKPQATPTSPVTDIKTLVPDDMQFRFTYPEDTTIDVIVRQSGYYLNKLPQPLRGQVKRDKATGLYPVVRPENVKKLNAYYNQAADLGQVKEEPMAAL